MTYGVTSTGFVKKTLTEIRAEIDDDLRDTVDASLNLLDSSVFGQFNGVIGDKLRELWDVAEAVYRAMYPDSASAEALDQVGSITGAYRLGATRSEVTLDQLFLDDGVTIPVGSVVSVGASGNRFFTTAAVSNSSGAPGTFSTTAESEEYGEILALAQSIDTIQTAISGWNAKAAITSANAETYDIDNGQTLTIKVDQGATQTATFETADFVDIDNATAAELAAVINTDITRATAYDAGGYLRIASDTDGAGSAIQVTGGTANTEIGFDTGIIKGFNAADADVGRTTEEDPDFRLRRIELLELSGSATVDAIRAACRAVPDVDQSFVYENTALTTSPEGLPGKSFMALVLGGADQAIADAIWDVKPAGILSYGGSSPVSKTVTDSMGFSHTIEFARPVEVPIHIELTITIDSGLYPADGDDQVKEALAAYGDALSIGEDVIALQFKCVPLSVAGVVDVTVFKIDIVDPPTGLVNIAIDFDEIATFDTADMDLTTV